MSRYCYDYFKQFTLCSVIPAQAGIQSNAQHLLTDLINLAPKVRFAPHWIPACAGMTVVWVGYDYGLNDDIVP